MFKRLFGNLTSKLWADDRNWHEANAKRIEELLAEIEAEAAEEEPEQDEIYEPTPAYEEDTFVHTYNPYLDDFLDVDTEGLPLAFEVQEIIYDTEDEMFRYLLEGNDGWYSEAWLVPMEYPFMVKELRPIAPVEVAKGLPVKASIDEQLDEYNELRRQSRQEEARAIIRKLREEEGK